VGFYEKLQGIVGGDYVSDSPDVCRSYAYNTFISYKYSAPPDIVCQPQTTEQVSEVVKAANQYGVPITPKGLAAGTGQGGFYRGGVLLDLLYMDKILTVDPVNMKTVAEAGASFFKLSQELFKAGMMLPTTEYSPGPNVAASAITPVNAFGKTRYGRNSDLVEGFEVVLPTGEICRVGSMAYEHTEFGPFYRYIHGPDLVGLFVMANGAYGIVTKVAYACQKRPPNWGNTSYYWTEDQIQNVTDFMLDATGMELYDIHLNDRWRYSIIALDGKGNIVPEKNLLAGLPESAYFFIHTTLNAFSGDELRAKIAIVDDLAEKHKGVKMGETLNEEFFGKWPTLHVPMALIGQILKPLYEMDKANYHFIYDSINYPTSRFPDVYTKIKEACERHGIWGLPRASILDAFPMRSQVICSQTWAFINTRSERWLNAIMECRDEIREWFGACGGTHQQHFPPIVPAYAWENQASDHALLVKIKKALDPNNIMSPTTFDVDVKVEV
jgi:FAD/FMN-containing dehydrogenase